VEEEGRVKRRCSMIEVKPDSLKEALYCLAKEASLFFVVMGCGRDKQRREEKMEGGKSFDLSKRTEFR
jgi:hypothetical protein